MRLLESAIDVLSLRRAGAATAGQTRSARRLSLGQSSSGCQAKNGLRGTFAPAPSLPWLTLSAGWLAVPDTLMQLGSAFTLIGTCAVVQDSSRPDVALEWMHVSGSPTRTACVRHIWQPRDAAGMAIMLRCSNEVGMPRGGRSGGFRTNGLRQPQAAPAHPGDTGLIGRRCAAQDAGVRMVPRWPGRLRRSGRPGPGRALRVGRQRRRGFSRQRPAQGPEEGGHPRHRRDHGRHLRLGEQILELAAIARRPRHGPDQPGVASGQRIAWRRVSGRRGMQAGAARLGGGGSQGPECPGSISGGEGREPSGNAAQAGADQQDQRRHHRAPAGSQGRPIQTLDDHGEAVREIGGGWRGG